MRDETMGLDEFLLFAFGALLIAAGIYLKPKKEHQRPLAIAVMVLAFVAAGAIVYFPRFVRMVNEGVHGRQPDVVVRLNEPGTGKQLQKIYENNQTFIAPIRSTRERTLYTVWQLPDDEYCRIKRLVGGDDPYAYTFLTPHNFGFLLNINEGLRLRLSETRGWPISMYFYTAENRQGESVPRC